MDELLLVVAHTGNHEENLVEVGSDPLIIDRPRWQAWVRRSQVEHLGLRHDPPIMAAKSGTDREITEMGGVWGDVGGHRLAPDTNREQASDDDREGCD